MLQVASGQKVIVGQVKAVSKERVNSLGAKNIGLLIKCDVTGQKEWFNYYFNNGDIGFADYVRVVIKGNTHTIKKVEPSELDF